MKELKQLLLQINENYVMDGSGQAQRTIRMGKLKKKDKHGTMEKNDSQEKQNALKQRQYR